MNRLNKELVQKLVAVALLLAFVLYGYFSLLINPINRKMEEADARLSELRQQVSQADAQIMRTRQMEEQALGAREALDNMQAYFPGGAPIAWFPPMVSDFFDRQGVGKTVTKSNSTTPSGMPELEDYEVHSWSIQLLEADFMKAGFAIAGLENQQPFLEIDELRIEPSPEDIGKQKFSMAVKQILKKQ